MYTNLLPAPPSVYKKIYKKNRKNNDSFRASKASALFVSAVCKNCN